MLGLEKRERMLADPVIPVRMIDPSDIEAILKSKVQIQVRPMTQFIKNDAIVNPFDPHFFSVPVVKQLPAALPDFGHATAGACE